MSTILDNSHIRQTILNTMSDAPILTESPTPTLAEIAKPAPATSPPGETAAPLEQTTPLTKTNARETLQTIAEGPKQASPAERATQATPDGKPGQEEQKIPDKMDVNKTEQRAETEPNKEKLDSLLTQSAQIFLDAKDPRVVTVALARASAASTPLGAELRRDVAHMIAEHKGDQLTAQTREELTKIQNELRLLNLPVTDAARSEFANTLEAFAAGHPDRGITPALIEQVRTNVQSRPDGITNLMKADSTLTARLMTELQGDAKESFPNVGTPEGLVKAAGLPETAETSAKAAELLRPKFTPPTKEPVDIGTMVLQTSLITSMTLMFVASLAGAGGEGGGGH